MDRNRTAGVAACIAALALTSQLGAQFPVARRPAIVSDGHTRIFDPKLGGSAEASFHLVGPSSLAVDAEVRDANGGLVTTLYSGTVVSGSAPTVVSWSGKDPAGGYEVTGTYAIVVSSQAGGGPLLRLPVDVVRLGITEIEFQDSLAGNDEWQMVYFKKNFLDGVFYATPAIHEYFNTKSSSEISDLDLDDGTPRPDAKLHTATDEPVMSGTVYETQRYNYPLAYIAGHTPRAQITFGDGGTTSGGVAMSSNYPVDGYDIRLVANLSTGGKDESVAIKPGLTTILNFDPLPTEVRGLTMNVTWTWEYLRDGAFSWESIPGAARTTHRFYTLLGEPKWKAGASGTQYTGPWVEVAEKFDYWQDTLGIDTSTDTDFVTAFVKGFAGQNGGIPTSIEGVLYDAGPLGGDGGATHYFSSGSWSMDLSALLNLHAKGVYVNCTDCMGATTTMLSMLGLSSVRPLRLGNMNLKAIWGIGAPGYTLSLWGFSHGFSYHHIVTRTNGTTVIDTCMQLDEDGNPTALPGIPGWNDDRPWTGASGYDFLSSSNSVSKTLENLPGVH